jgi:hypothetical protein
MTKNTRYALEMRAALIKQLSVMPSEKVARLLRKMRSFNREMMKRNLARRRRIAHKGEVT